MSYLKQTLHHQYSQWFFNFMWLKEYFHGDRLRRWAAVLALSLGTVIGLQMLYPHNLALPRTRISGDYVGFQSRESITNKVNAYNGSTLRINVEGEQLSVAPKDVGITINGTATANRALEYTWQDRLIPFSAIFTKRHIQNYSFVTEPSQTQKFAEELAKKNKGASDAKLKINATNAIIEPGQNGYSYQTGQVQSQLDSAKLDTKFETSIVPAVIEPNITTDIAEQAAAQVRTRIEKPLKLTAAGQVINIDSKTVAEWFVITPKPEEKTIKVDYDRKKVRTTLMGFSSKIYIAETPNKVIIVDGQSSGPAGGVQGQALLLDASVDEVLAAATNNTEQVDAKVVAITPSTQFVHTYTKTSKGVQMLIDRWASSHGGQFGITMRTMDGQIVASHNGDKAFTSASVYKIYVAYLTYQRVKAGQTSLGSVESYVDGMIVHSYNTTAHILGDQLGWGANDDALRAKGYFSTSLVYGGHYTSANDTATFLMQLEKGELNGGEYDKLLLDKMKRQAYRFGIPAGSKGMEVANKIGDYGPYQHDVGIVYHPKGTYVLSVMSSGSSIYQYADLARQINEVMNQ